MERYQMQEKAKKLEKWLNENLGSLVEKIVREEIKKYASDPAFLSLVQKIQS